MRGYSPTWPERPTGFFKAKRCESGNCVEVMITGDNVHMRQTERTDRVADREQGRTERQGSREEAMKDRQDDRQDWADSAREDRQDFWDNQIEDVEWNNVDWDEWEVHDDDDFEWSSGAWFALGVGTVLTVSAWNTRAGTRTRRAKRTTARANGRREVWITDSRGSSTRLSSTMPERASPTERTLGRMTRPGRLRTAVVRSIQSRWPDTVSRADYDRAISSAS